MGSCFSSSMVVPRILDPEVWEFDNEKDVLYGGHDDQRVEEMFFSPKTKDRK